MTPAEFIELIMRKRSVAKTEAVKIAAQLIGVTSATIFFWLSGRRSPSSQSIQLITLYGKKIEAE